MTPQRWDDLEQLFGPNGAIAGCWCMWWRLSGRQWDELGMDGRRRALHRLVTDGDVPGLLAYRDTLPVGWVSLGPRERFGRLQRSPVLGRAGSEDPRVWSIVCFYLPARERRRGVGRALLDAAVDHARERGATSLEAYPVDLAAVDRRWSSNDLFTGVLTMFADAGFQEVARHRPNRPIVRRDLT
ncbi:MAG TPA: GNAT family N-acetyltransferase [Nitriliruptorales bacterium]|nr:GNAT family N-acetyltransferase [Nitriliruptorales bacterium]